MDAERTAPILDRALGVARTAMAMTGLEFISRALDGSQPAPIGATIGHDRRVGEGEVAFALVPQEFHYNPLGTVHGGILSTMLDSAAGCAVHTTLARGRAGPA